MGEPMSDDRLEDAQQRILTPDQRPRVFISSTLAELASERLAARRAVESVRLIPVMFELGARPHPARALYRAYLAQSHVFVGVYAQRYGWVAPEESISGLEDEYRLSGALPKLVYVKAVPDREERLEALLDRVRADDQVSYKAFADADELERLLREDLVVLLAERFLLGGPAEAAESESGRTQPRRTSALPRPLTALVGRAGEVADVTERLLGGARLVTLVGPGGIGKTRVALAVAGSIDAVRPGEVVFVPLDTVREAAAVLPAIATALGIGLDGSVPPIDALARALRDRRLLLVADNLEQVLDCAPDLRALLEGVPGLSVLATSRAPLRLRGEQQVAIGPLSLPGEGTPVTASAAARLFVERAAEVRPDLDLSDPADAAAVAELARRLEGIPLALELAAARSRTLPPQALLQRVRTALDVGSGASDVPTRQRTLRDTVAWSEELLRPPERALLAQLAVFQAPWTLEDAEAVAGPDAGDVESGVGALVEHSLVRPSASATGEPRFRLYEAVRAYALERAGGVDATTGLRYVHRMASVIRVLDAGFRSPDHDRWRAEFRLIWPDVRTALDLALQHEDAEVLGRLTGAWVGLWMDGRGSEIGDRVERSLALADRQPPADHGDVVLSALGLAFNLGDEERSRALVTRMLTEDPPGALPEKAGTVALYRGYLDAGSGDLAAAEEHLREAAQRLHEHGAQGRWIAAFAHNGLGSLYALRGQLEQSYGEFGVSEDLGRRYGNVAAEMQSLVFVAAMRVGTGEADEAARLLKAAADIVDRYPFYESNAYCVEIAGAVALARGDAVAAAEALGAAQALRDVVGARVWPLLAGVKALIEQNVRAALPEAEFDVAVARGREIDVMTLADLVRALVGG